MQAMRPAWSTPRLLLNSYTTIRHPRRDESFSGINVCLSVSVARAFRYFPGAVNFRPRIRVYLGEKRWTSF